MAGGSAAADQGVGMTKRNEITRDVSNENKASIFLR